MPYTPICKLLRKRATMTMWLISYRLRRVFRRPTGELDYSTGTTDRIELTAASPAAFVAQSAAVFKIFTDHGDSLPNDVTACDRIEAITSVVPVDGDALTGDQLQILEETYAEEECHG